MKKIIFLLRMFLLAVMPGAVVYGNPVDDFYVFDYQPLCMTIAENDGEDHPGWTRLYIVQDAQHGDTIGHEWGLCISYVPYGNYIGLDYFTYRYLVSDNPPTWSGTATVSILVIGNEDRQNAGRSCNIRGGVRAGAGMSASVGEPVNVTNGNMWLEQTDYSLPGIGENIEINRFYNSMIQEAGLFGWGWSTKYDEQLAFYDDRMIRLDQPDGKAAFFGRVNTTDPFRSFSPDVTGQLVKNVDNTYTLTFKDGRIHHFASTGSLLWQKDRNGNQTTLSYDTNGFLISVTDPFSRTLTFTPNTDGTVASISDSLGTIATYEYYTGTTQLKTVTYPDGSKFKFEYDSATVPGKVFLKTVKDALDNILETHAYDSLGRATTSEKHGGVEKYTLVYNSAPTGNPGSGLTTVTDALGRVTKYTYIRKYGTNLITKTEGVCSCGGAGSEVTEYTYSEIFVDRLRLTTKKDAFGVEIDYTYDADGNVLKQKERNGGFVFWEDNYTYNSFGQVLTHTDRMNGVTTNTYSTNGNLLTTTDPLNKTTTLTYTTLGQPETVTDARNNTTTLTYDTQGRLTEVEDANNETTTYGYDARARLTSKTNALSETTTFEYDLNNRLKKVIYPDTNFVTHTYDLAGRRTGMTDARNNTTTFGYDNAYRLTSITDALSHSRTFGYDLMSNRTSQTDALGNTTDYEYNDFNRVKKIIYPPASSGATRLEESFTYDNMGNVKTRVDTAGRTTSYDYDLASRLIKLTDTANQFTQFEYNARSQMTKVKDALNQEYVFTYDPLSRQLTQTRAGTTMTFEYDAVGNRIERTDYMGRVTDYTYDNLNRLTNVDYDGSTNFATYAYDDISRLTTATNQVGTVSFTYDNRNRIETSTDVFGHVVEYGYDANSNRTQLKLDTNVHTDYVYDAANRLTTLTDEASQNFVFNYDAANRMSSKTLPNGVVTNYTYDDMSRLKELKHSFGVSTLFDFQYAFNTAQQISQIAAPSVTQNYSYDNTDRLTNVANPTVSVESFSYDAVGNRTASHLASGYSYDPFNRLVGTTGSPTMDWFFTYDANGNRIQKTNDDPNDPQDPAIPLTYAYSWDEENRLVSADGDSSSVSYDYDALGRRVKRTADTETEFSYDGPDVVMDDDTSIGITTYQNGLGIDNKLKFNDGNDFYFLQDHLGSTIGLSNSIGGSQSPTSYDSFGGNSHIDLPTRYRYTGREEDPATGLYYYRARWYDPNVGRFMSEDPIGFMGGDVNLYGYVRNQPLWFRDPMGLQPGGDIMSHPNTWRAVGAAAATAGAFVPPVAVAAGGAAAIYAAWQLGDAIARHPSNPLSHPWIPPSPAQPMPPLSTPARPYCQPLPRVIPIPRSDAIPMPTPNGEGCAQEWADAYTYCAENMGNFDKRHTTGGYTSLYDCARGLVSQRCGGNRVE